MIKCDRLVLDIYTCTLFMRVLVIFSSCLNTCRQYLKCRTRVYFSLTIIIRAYFDTIKGTESVHLSTRFSSSVRIKNTL